MNTICFNATSSLMAGGCASGVATIILTRNHPRLKWGAIALMGITAMQWVEGFVWLDGPTPHGALNQFLTIGLIPLALLAQAWGPFSDRHLTSQLAAGVCRSFCCSSWD